MKTLLITFTSLIIGCYSDVIRTVYCKNQCTDYLGIPENSMPLCAPEHLKLKECGTVITCDWAEAERDKVRPVANSTSDMLCCYRTTIKEKGDCGEAAAPSVTHSGPVQEPVPFADACTIQFIPWLLCIVLLIVVTLQLRLLKNRERELVPSFLCADGPALAMTAGSPGPPLFYQICFYKEPKDHATSEQKVSSENWSPALSACMTRHWR
ncbi:hypothetical protein Y032_0032g2480 [Ancylostoma ceylanicum]|uniref:Uncharacterized protein n=1 Tax=Ancylostoma ceylanicum TaxID=53326 RepID=A0A016UPG0_9BILA|nr:hypothetical protein Y032_0032g2480 [Ancylostoma ceylanicum]